MEEERDDVGGNDETHDGSVRDQPPGGARPAHHKR